MEKNQECEQELLWGRLWASRQVRRVLQGSSSLVSKKAGVLVLLAYGSYCDILGRNSPFCHLSSDTSAYQVAKLPGQKVGEDFPHFC